MDEKLLNPLGSLPDGSISAKQQKKEQEKPRLEPVTDTPGIIKKKSLWERSKDAIFSEDTSTVGGYILRDVIIPAVRDTIYDMVTGGLSMMLYSTPKASKGQRRGGSNGTYISYGDYYDGGQKTKPKRIEPADRYRNHLDINNIIVPNSNVGYGALELLGDRAEIYGAVTVQDLYDVLNIGSAPSTMSNWGWTDISQATVSLERGDWVLHMPKIIPLR